MHGNIEASHRVASTDGVEIALHRFGGTGPTLVLCHATGFHGRAYLPMQAQLGEHFDVWALDFRGHGASTAPADPAHFAWAGFAHDLLSCIDFIGAESVLAFGHSMGGASTLLAEKKRPGVIEAAWLYEPIIFPPEITPRNSMMAAAAEKRRANFDSKADALYRYACRPPLAILRADALAAYVEFGFDETSEGTVTLACAPEHEALTFNNARTGIEDIRGLTPRIMIATGMSIVEPSPAGFAAPAAEALASANLMHYNGLGHFGPFQDPERIAGDVTDFLSA